MILTKIYENIFLNSFEFPSVLISCQWFLFEAGKSLKKSALAASKKVLFFLQPPAQLQNTVIRLADYHFDLATGCCCRVDLPLVLVRATRFHQCFCRWLPAGFRSQVA